jgi:hypothetical protein
VLIVSNIQIKVAGSTAENAAEENETDTALFSATVVMLEQNSLLTETKNNELYISKETV